MSRRQNGIHFVWLLSPETSYFCSFALVNWYVTVIVVMVLPKIPNDVLKLIIILGIIVTMLVIAFVIYINKIDIWGGYQF